MGYCARIKSSRFAIPRERQHEALQAVKADLRAGGQFRYVNVPDALKAPTLDAMLEEWGWAGDYDDDSNLIALSFKAEKLGGEDQLWAALAPYVAAGSFIEMLGEDGDRWQWRFDGVGVRTVKAIVSYAE